MNQFIAVSGRWVVILIIVVSLLTTIPEPAPGQEPPQRSATQPAVLQEAEQLNQQVLKLYSDGKYDTALPLAQRALAIREQILGPQHPSVAISLSNLASLYRAKGQYDHAEALYQRALVISEKALGPEHPTVAVSLNSLAVLYHAKGDYARAVPLYQRTMAKLEKSLSTRNTDVATSLNNLAGLYHAKGDYARAEPLYQRALTILEQVLGPQHPHVAATLNNLAWLYQAKGERTQAVAFMTRGNDIQELNLLLILATGSEDQKRAYAATLGNETASTVLLHTKFAPHDPQALRLALTTILRRKGRVLDAMTSSVMALRRHLRPEDQALLDQLAAVRFQLATLVLKGPSKPGDLQPALRRIQLEMQAEQLEAQVSTHSAEFRTQTQPVTLEQVEQAIPQDAALVEVVSYKPFNPQARKPEEQWDAPRYVAYALRRQEEPKWTDLGESAPIDREVIKFRAALGNKNRADVKELARALDDKVMRPIRPLLGNARLILLSPDGALNLIPFGALMDEDDRYLIERFTFTYLTTGRDLLRLQTKSQRQQGPVVIANPDFDDGGKPPLMQMTAARGEIESQRSGNLPESYESLPGTEEEAREIEEVLVGSTVLTGTAATEAALKRIHGPRLLHIATHGFFLADQRRGEHTREIIIPLNKDTPQRLPYLQGENPLLRSGLALAGYNRRQSDDEDGVLTALEVAGLDLWGTKLVVLSACKTGVGDVQNGEGVYGLRRALVMAGAESQVMSLWDVDDEATRELMVAYYKRLLTGKGRAEALQQVQLGMLNSERRQHPYYWAGFIPSGAWTPLQE